ncbi:TniQ family protein [Acinetobacter higginsii]|uniref:TniQ family protein n=1 Tax=Acinetobacter higginsii TaxID=70347 RepID=UPI003009C9B9
MIDTTAIHSWFIPTALQQDEALSSWLIRAALDSGCDPLSLTGALWPKWRIWSTDVDRGLSSEHLQILVNKTKIDETQFDSATFRNFLIKYNLNNETLDAWYLALGTRNRKHRGGWQYCPECLSNDDIAYFRLPWRFAWYIGCIKHNQRLHDQCPHCHNAIQPRRLEASDQVVTCCSICKKSLLEVNESLVDLHAFVFQNNFDHYLKQGYAIYQDKFVLLNDWLKVIKLFSQFIRKVLASPLSWKGWAFLEQLRIQVPHIELISNGLVVSQLSVLERERLFSCIYQLLIIPQEKFIETAQSLNMNRSSFWDKRNQLPDILRPIEEQLRSVNRKYPPKRRGFDVCKPKSKEAVMRKFLRLKRKLG